MKIVSIKKITVLCVLIFTMQACKNEYYSVGKVGYTVRVAYPELYSQQYATGASVVMKNTVTNYSYTGTTNGEGEVVFSDLVPGSYQLSVSREVKPEEALTLTGFEEQLFLNASSAVQKVTSDGSLELRLQGGKVGSLVFKEIYYVGSRTPAGGTYFSDQFYEIYNNSTDTIYADSLLIGNTGGAAGNSSSAKPYGFQTDAGNVYLQNVWMVPGNGKTYPIAPGKSIIISQDGINHQTDPLGNPSSPVNLGPGISDFESYVERSDNRDLDAAGVDNLLPVYLGSVGFDWLTAVFGASMVIFKHPDPSGLPLKLEPGSTSVSRYVQVPRSSVIDGVELLANGNAFSFKRLPVAVDAGFTFCSGTYTGQSVRRKVKTIVGGRRVLLDTNNSTADFEVLTTPTPKNWQ
ncbi:DUF4876 domain-containing protein [Pararcticibacter amylolyticus]|uniref:DUF4876 domain-containing protein n=1 Tax=Pararcticibacter amylolyticus TaxID=2173175 RepID=A0A2U2PJK5_9SPHI|nr:DUF4876 domain-containing protein [Pararcticibacter amylolyticus]PWG81583.1 DUF4876 domain-containing protein [Pararcticibacter amylolyticus]